MKDVIFSGSAEQHGYGTDRWKRVVNMTPEERAHVRAGGIVLFEADRLSGGNHGTYLRMAVDHGRYGFVPRVPHSGIVEIHHNSSGLVEDTPPELLQDWYAERGMVAAAEYIREMVPAMGADDQASD